MNARRGLYQPTRRWTSANTPAFAYGCRQLGQDALSQLRPQLGQMAIQNLRYRALDCLLELLAIRHALKTAGMTLQPLSAQNEPA